MKQTEAIRVATLRHPSYTEAHKDTVTKSYHFLGLGSLRFVMPTVCVHSSKNFYLCPSPCSAVAALGRILFKFPALHDNKVDNAYVLLSPNHIE